jgi:predicted lipoprotein with Yx(FWY)xxD motif
VKSWPNVLRAGIAAATLCVLAPAPAVIAAGPAVSVEREDYAREPMPVGIQVIWTELEGPVFADAQGRTLYQWPRQGLRNGDAGEEKGAKPQCNGEVTRETAGLQSPYPAGLLLPDLDTRPSCEAAWPPAVVANAAKPVGKWTAVERKDGRKQWAYDGFPLYTSFLDRQPGDTYGGTKRQLQGDFPAVRLPVGPPPNVPPELAVGEIMAGRLLTTYEGYSAYAWDKDQPTKSHCEEACLRDWTPIIAPQSAQARGEWTIIERSPGVHQWVFRGHPLYRRVADQRFRSLEGSDEPGWHNVFTQRSPTPPAGFSVQNTRAGQVLADPNGRTIYTYICSDDSVDQLACDHPDMTQAMRLAICGGGDADRCAKTFPYVVAAPGAKSDNRVWTVIDIDPKSGHRAKPGQAGALHVWAYRDRPVYTFGGDKKAGDINGDAWGEFTGWRNGFKAFWLRDDFFANAG